MPGTPGATPNPAGGSNPTPSANPAATPDPNTGTQTPAAQTPTQDFTPSNDTGIEVRAVNPPLTPDQLVGIYNTPLPQPSLPTLKLDNVKVPNVKNRTLTGYLKAIEGKMTSTEKLMKNIVKLQRLQILTEKEVSERKRELYQNTFEEYLLDKTVDFGDKKKKGCTCINLPENIPQAAAAPLPTTPPNPNQAKQRQNQSQTAPQTQTQGQKQNVPSTQGKPDTAPAPKPGFQLPDWLNPKNLPKPQNPFPNGIPIPPIPRLPDFEGLPGFAAAKNLVTPKNLAILGSVIGAGAMMRGSQVQAITPFESEAFNKSSSLFSAPDAGVPTAAPMLANASGRIINYAKGGIEPISHILPQSTVMGYIENAPQANGGVTIPDPVTTLTRDVRTAANGGMTSDLELYNSGSLNYFRNLSQQANKIASDIPVGPHTPLPHPGYVRPQGGYIPRPNLRGMPNPMGKPMPWGWQPTLLAKGGITAAADGKMFGPSWMPWNWGKLVDQHRNTKPSDYANQQGLGANLARKREMYKQMGMYAGGGISNMINELNPFTHILRLSNKLVPPTRIKPKMPSLPASARQVTQYPEGISTGVGGGNASASTQRVSPNRRTVTPISKPISKPTESVQKKVDPYANDLSKYEKLISEGKTEEAEKLGMEIWSRKYANTNLTAPRTANPLMNTLETAQNNLMNNSSATNTSNIKTIPLPPDYIKIPKANKQTTKDSNTWAPPPGVGDMPTSIFSRETGFYR